MYAKTNFLVSLLGIMMDCQFELIDMQDIMEEIAEDIAAENSIKVNLCLLADHIEALTKIVKDEFLAQNIASEHDFRTLKFYEKSSLFEDDPDGKKTDKLQSSVYKARREETQERQQRNKKRRNANFKTGAHFKKGKGDEDKNDSADVSGVCILF